MNPACRLIARLDLAVIYELLEMAGEDRNTYTYAHAHSYTHTRKHTRTHTYSMDGWVSEWAGGCDVIYHIRIVMVLLAMCVAVRCSVCCCVLLRDQSYLHYDGVSRGQNSHEQCICMYMHMYLYLYLSMCIFTCYMHIQVHVCICICTCIFI